MTGSNWLRKRTIVYTPSAGSGQAAPSPKDPGRGTRFSRRLGGAAWRGLKKTAMAVGFITMIWILVTGWALFSVINVTEAPLPEQMVLYWEVDEGILERPGDPSLTKPLLEKPTVHAFVRALDKAATDPRVKGLIMNYHGGAVALAHIEELHAAIHRFRESGKPAYFYAADLAGGLGAYYLGTAFEEMWMQPVGSLVINGINMETPYVKDVLDEIGVTAQFYRRKEYKTLYESATHSEMTPAQREMMTALVTGLGENIVTTIATNRSMTPDQVMEAINTGLLTDEEALAAGLIDRLAYGDQLLARMREIVGGDVDGGTPPLIDIEGYGQRAAHGDSKAVTFGGEKETEARTALIYISGMILPDDGEGAPPLFGGNVASANSIAGAISDAADDPGTRAIVIRIDSPGGSPSASETIRWAIVKAKEKGKPVIVSMGPMAASGGYWVSAPADRIFALPTTLTGSIGVVSGKIIFGGLWDKLGVNWESVEWGGNADMWSINEPFDERAEERINSMVDSIYNTFIRVVAEGRGMTPEQVDRVARGYVWTGSRAVEAGLVDELGGLDVALDYVARSIGLQSRRDLLVEVMPRPKTPLERLMTMFGAEVAASRSLQVQADLLAKLEPVLREASYMERADELSVFSRFRAP